jgi:hypothetical protein
MRRAFRSVKAGATCRSVRDSRSGASNRCMTVHRPMDAAVTAAIEPVKGSYERTGHRAERRLITLTHRGRLDSISSTTNLVELWGAVAPPPPAATHPAAKLVGVRPVARRPCRRLSFATVSAWQAWQDSAA